ncbi:hypothetical protein TIFTF001_036132 [Ficus carica]|uniref:Laccase n=1 Tax=Ficus carica TaxID=3494 RepID=A0AA88E2T0_FICCA|nr:hypothetical protein TIFTF001_036116 [Ficus carica]GMN67074.1 hypothetical protein TIFTF001_036132 [Ficus carica]
MGLNFLCRHGIFQLRTPWADGASYVTQCPIRPGQSYTYRFNVTGQEGTLWWHAHLGFLRATVYGALIIRPKHGQSAYPFAKPHKEIPILLGEWWNTSVVDIENWGLDFGVTPNISNGYSINGKPGDLYPCSKNDMYKIEVEHGKTYMLRIINTALNNQLFFKIANHKMTVVAIDAAYTDPYDTDIVVTAPGQTVDVLIKADQLVGLYYMAARTYMSIPPEFLFLLYDKTITRAIFAYKGSKSKIPVMPALPDSFDSPTAHKFHTNMTGLAGGPNWVPVPLHVDEHMFMTVGVNIEPCPKDATCRGPLGGRLSSSINNESFVLPQNASMLEAFYYGNRSGVYTTDFPDNPPLTFDYTNAYFSFEESLIYAPKSTKAKKLKFNATVEIVFQNTAFLAVMSHPIHFHGFNFHVLAQGIGNYDAVEDRKKFNFVNPQIRNTIAFPPGGWAVIRFQANNPGIWFVHCHLEEHMNVGMSMAFEVESGPTPSSTLPPPPSDLPKC